MTVQTETFRASTSLTERFSAFRAQFADKAAKRKVFRTTVSELESLSTRDLDDLGLSRCMIKAIAHEAAYGK